MKIAYVKTRKDKDPILQMLRQILPEDKITCADISTVIGSGFDRVKISHIFSKDHPGLLVAYGEAAGVLANIYPKIPAIMIDPSGDISETSLDFARDTTKLFVVQTGMPAESLNADDLLKSIGPIMEPMREEIQNNENTLERLIEMAMVKTDAAPDDFDGNDNITDNLRRHMDTAVLSEKMCPDCGQRMINFHVCSPPETWARLCGRAGRLTYCPNCKTQHGFWLQFMN